MELEKLIKEAVVERIFSVTTQSPSAATFLPGKHIVILQRGWVVVGDVTQTGSAVEIKNASVIRKWGTTKGLGELALSGPLAETKLDPCGTVRAHELAIIATLKCEESKWPQN